MNEVLPLVLALDVRDDQVVLVLIKPWFTDVWSLVLLLRAAARLPEPKEVTRALLVVIL